MDINRLSEFLTHHWILSLSLIAVLLALAADPLLRWLRGVRKVSAVEATRLINQENAQIIDIREEKEFDKEHILDSLNLPFSKFFKRLDSLDDFKDRPLVVIWGMGQRALYVAGQLSQRGHKAVYVLQGGIESWREGNMPLFSGKTKVKANLTKPNTKAEAPIPTTEETPTTEEIPTTKETPTAEEISTAAKASTSVKTGRRPKPASKRARQGKKAKGGKKTKTRRS